MFSNSFALSPLSCVVNLIKRVQSAVVSALSIILLILIIILSLVGEGSGLVIVAI